jgi:hypothetical protein
MKNKLPFSFSTVKNKLPLLDEMKKTIHQIKNMAKNMTIVTIL